MYQFFVLFSIYCYSCKIHILCIVQYILSSILYFIYRSFNFTTTLLSPDLSVVTSHRSILFYHTISTYASDDEDDDDDDEDDDDVDDDDEDDDDGMTTRTTGRQQDDDEDDVVEEDDDDTPS